jgi:hypothetical protein
MPDRPRAGQADAAGSRRARLRRAVAGAVLALVLLLGALRAARAWGRATASPGGSADATGRFGLPSNT